MSTKLRDLTGSRRALAFISIMVVYFFYCYNFLLGTFTRPTMLKAVAAGGFGFTPVQASSIFAVLSFATIPGTIIFGAIVPYIGKRKTLALIAFLIAGFTGLPLIAPTNVQLWRASRFITGLALGGVFGTAQALSADLFAEKWRGKLAAILTSLFAIAWTSGSKVYGALGDAQWKLLVFSAIIPQIIGGIMVLLFVPAGAGDIAVKKANGKIDRPTYLEMFKGKYALIGAATIILSGMNFVGYSLFSNNSTLYLRTLGYDAATVGSIQAWRGHGMLVGYWLWGAISDKWGRKIPLVGMIAAAAGVFYFTKIGANNASTYSMVSLLLGLMIGFSGGWGAYYTELFPRRFSGMSTGISFNGGRILSTFGIPFLTSLAVGTGIIRINQIYMYAMFAFIIGPIVWALLPETKGKDRD